MGFPCIGLVITISMEEDGRMKLAYSWRRIIFRVFTVMDVLKVTRPATHAESDGAVRHDD